MTSRIGMIEWMDNTTVLKDMVLSSMSPDELMAFKSAKDSLNPQVCAVSLQPISPFTIGPTGVSSRVGGEVQ